MNLSPTPRAHLTTSSQTKSNNDCVFAGRGLVACLTWFAASACNAAAPSGVNLGVLSLEELGDVEVTSVSRHSEPLAESPSSIYVITHEDIIRSGATSLGEILRLAPNVQVAQVSASRYIITVHGLSGNSEAQNFANKLLVLVDGRSVYSPLFSGVYWDMSSVLPEDVDRVEVISGPGATMWGANAVNGVINVITKASSETLGGVADIGAGNQQRRGAFRYGGQINDALTGRAYALGFRDEDTLNTTETDAGDGWSKSQAGFRLDLAPASGTLTALQGDAYHGTEHRGLASNEEIDGHNLLLRWTRIGIRGAELRTQAFYDKVSRDSGPSGRFRVETWDLDLQHSLQAGAHELVLGGGYRSNRYRITGTTAFFFDPAAQNLNLVNAFLQDTIALGQSVKVTAGLKLEDQSYADLAALPTLRVAWNASDRTNVWAAVSRAIRSSTPFDRDVVEKLGSLTFLTGDKNFKAEKLIAYEAGLRVAPEPDLKLSASVFYNDYSDLRSIEFSPTGGFPLHWGNQLQGYTYGADLWGTFQINERWQLSGAYSYLNEQLAFDSTSSQLLGVKQAGNDPRHRASLTNSLNVARGISVDVSLRYISELPEPRVPSYVDLNSRIAWRIHSQLEASLAGWNLLHRSHREYAGGEANLIPRTLLLNLQWTF